MHLCLVCLSIDARRSARRDSGFPTNVNCVCTVQCSAQRVLCSILSSTSPSTYNSTRSTLSRMHRSSIICDLDQEIKGIKRSRDQRIYINLPLPSSILFSLFIVGPEKGSSGCGTTILTLWIEWEESTVHNLYLGCAVHFIEYTLWIWGYTNYSRICICICIYTCKVELQTNQRICLLPPHHHFPASTVSPYSTIYLCWIWNSLLEACFCVCTHPLFLFPTSTSLFLFPFPILFPDLRCSVRISTLHTSLTAHSLCNPLSLCRRFLFTF